MKRRLRIDIKDWLTYKAFFIELRVNQDGIRYEQRQPPIWMQINLKNGKCWCGKPKSLFAPQQRKYCCGDHSNLWIWSINAYWNSFRTEILRRDEFTCQECGFRPTCPVCKKNRCEHYRDDRGLEVDHIVAITLGGGCYDWGNVRTVCHDCHLLKTSDDMKKKSHERKSEGMSKLDLFVTDD